MVEKQRTAQNVQHWPVKWTPENRRRVSVKWTLEYPCSQSFGDWRWRPPGNPWRTAAKKGEERSFSESLKVPPRTSEAKQLRGSGQIRRAVYYLRGISPECTAVDIQRYCDQRRIRVSSCRILQTRRFGTNVARLSVAQIDAEKEGMMSENFWPEHITIRPWVFPEEGEIITDSLRS